MICYLNYSISPYHRARFHAIREHISDEVVFVELASRDLIYEWDSQADDVQAVTLFPGREFSTIPPAVMTDAMRAFLDKTKPDVVLSSSYGSAPMRAGSLWTRRNGAVSICVNNSWRANKTRFFLFEAIKGLWCRYAYDGMFLSGERCKDYYTGLGFPAQRVWLGQNAVDNDYFARQTARARENEASVRVRYGLPGHYFLCAARLSPEKNLPRFLRAFSRYRDAGGSLDLVLVGSGPMEAELKTLTESLGLVGRVHFTGWKQVDEMPVYYAFADCLVLPSLSETWGNVVNEAMASALPVLVSDRCGCQPELCFEGVNGFRFDPYREDEMAAAMNKISDLSANRRLRMGQASSDLVRRFSLDNYAASLADCIATLRADKQRAGRHG